MFWVREILGWLLVFGAVALVVMGADYLRLKPTPGLVEGSICMFGAAVVMRAGIMLVRVSTAARIVRDETNPK